MLVIKAVICFIFINFLTTVTFKTNIRLFGAH